MKKIAILFAFLSSLALGAPPSPFIFQPSCSGTGVYNLANQSCLVTGGGSPQTPWASNINGAGYDLLDTGSVETSVISTTSGDLTLEPASGDVNLDSNSLTYVWSIYSSEGTYTINNDGSFGLGGQHFKGDTSGNIGIPNNTGLHINGLSDNNWQVGRNLSAITSPFLSPLITTSTFDLISGNGAGEGFVFATNDGVQTLNLDSSHNAYFGGSITGTGPFSLQGSGTAPFRSIPTDILDYCFTGAPDALVYDTNGALGACDQLLFLQSWQINPDGSSSWGSTGTYPLALNINPNATSTSPVISFSSGGTGWQINADGSTSFGSIGQVQWDAAGNFTAATSVTTPLISNGGSNLVVGQAGGTFFSNTGELTISGYGGGGDSNIPLLVNGNSGVTNPWVVQVTGSSGYSASGNALTVGLNGALSGHLNTLDDYSGNAYIYNTLSVQNNNSSDPALTVNGDTSTNSLTMQAGNLNMNYNTIQNAQTINGVSSLNFVNGGTLQSPVGGQIQSTVDFWAPSINATNGGANWFIGSSGNADFGGTNLTWDASGNITAESYNLPSGGSIIDGGGGQINFTSGNASVSSGGLITANSYGLLSGGATIDYAGNITALSYTGNGSSLTGVLTNPLSADLNANGYNITSAGSVDLYYLYDYTGSTLIINSPTSQMNINTVRASGGAGMNLDLLNQNILDSSGYTAYNVANRFLAVAGNVLLEFDGTNSYSPLFWFDSANGLAPTVQSFLQIGSGGAQLQTVTGTEMQIQSSQVDFTGKINGESGNYLIDTASGKSSYFDGGVYGGDGNGNFYVQNLLLLTRQASGHTPTGTDGAVAMTSTGKICSYVSGTGWVNGGTGLACTF